MQKILSIDFGSKRVGLAEAKDSPIAFAIDPIAYSDYKNMLSDLAKMIKAFEYSKILIGLPLGYENKETEMSKKVRSFSSDLEKALEGEYEIIFWNEVFTSEIAKTNLKGLKKSIDSESARIILQEYLDNHYA
jgi:putative transcription antitermination factor YqgF